MRNRERRKISLGTKVMLVVAPLVLIGSILVVSILSSGKIPDVSRLRTGVSSQKEEGAGGKSANKQAGIQTENDREADTKPVGTTNAVNTGTTVRRGFTLTAAGTAVIEGDIRKNSYFDDVKVYDFSDVMSLLQPVIQSDVNILFLENIIDDNEKVTDVIVPSSLTAMLKTAGFNMAACGFSKAWEKGSEGVKATRASLIQQGILPLGIRDPGHQDSVEIREYGGIPTAILQYTDTIKTATRNKMTKQGESRTVPAADAEEIRKDIETARAKGAQAVIVLVNWGKSGAKQPDKAQRSLAQQIAEAGADLIIGSGSRYPQPAEYLTAENRQVLCIWSLGTTISGERKNVDWLSGYLFHAEITMDSAGQVQVSNTEYTPIYTWKSKISGKMAFRCLPANRGIPDGMDSDQQKTMERAAEVTRKALEGCPLAERMSGN